MVLFGGLEIVAAGYLLNNMHNDDKKNMRRGSDQRRKHSHHRHDSEHRPHKNRPSRQTLRPPEQQYPPRPSSAPPVSPSHPPPQWQKPQYEQPPQHYQRPYMQPQPTHSFPQIPQAQTFPMPNQRPAPSQSWNTAINSAYASTTIPPMQVNQNGQTMYLDVKTGKWQSGMLPPEMSHTSSGNRNRSNSEREPRSRAYSSGSEDSNDSDLAFGERPGPRQPRMRGVVHRIMSEERGRPERNGTPPPPYQVEGDWYSRGGGGGGQQQQGARMYELPG